MAKKSILWIQFFGVLIFSIFCDASASIISQRSKFGDWRVLVRKVDEANDGYLDLCSYIDLK